MSILPAAHDFVITGGDFRNVQTQNIYQHSSTGIDILYDASTPEAAVDAEERSYAPSCYPGTREQYIDDINKWATAGSSDDNQPIYWMKGPAGVGKSAIAQTCAMILKDEGQLGAAFFFSVNGRRKDHTRFFPTLAYQLATILSADCRNYREIINRRISDDKTLVKKTMASQFRSLIVEPLQELKEQGRELRRRAIFIDGLDECESQDAQVEIIQIIASSARNGSVPFCWAIFSREESHIVSTFSNLSVSSHCHVVFLPISREVDEEIELYLRGGFRNILQRRNLLSLSSSWPTTDDIKKLVNAAAGLFAHSALVLRFIDRHSYLGLQESLEDVIACITKPGTKAASLYAQLDKLYMLILQRVPKDILPAILLFLFWVALDEPNSGGWFIALICNVFGFSEDVFQSIYHHLRAVLIVRNPSQLKFDKAVALERSYYDQDPTFKPGASLKEQLREVHGTIGFHHKSFYDFITDSERSSTFCVTTPAVREKFLDHFIEQHSHFSSSYVIQDSRLILAPGATSSSVALPWPQGTEFADSFLRLWFFYNVSVELSHDESDFGQFLQGVPLGSLHRLAELDYRKSLIAYNMYLGPRLCTDDDVVGYANAGTTRLICNSIFSCIDKAKYNIFNPTVFLKMVGELQKAGIIRPFNPRFGTSRAISLLHGFFQQKPYGRSHGQYKMGHGDKSVIWYWEFDTKKQYFHEFQTLNFAWAMAYYKAKKFRIWEAVDEDHVTASDMDEAEDEDDVVTSEEDEVTGREGDVTRGREDNVVRDEDDQVVSRSSYLKM